MEIEYERNPDDIYGLLRERHLSFFVSCGACVSAGDGKGPESAPCAAGNLRGDAGSVFPAVIQNGDG